MAVARSVDSLVSYQGATAWASSLGVISPPTSIVSLVPTMQGSTVPANGPRNPPSTANTSLSWVRMAQVSSASTLPMGL